MGKSFLDSKRGPHDERAVRMHGKREIHEYKVAKLEGYRRQKSETRQNGV